MIINQKINNFFKGLTNIKLPYNNIELYPYIKQIIKKKQYNEFIKKIKEKQGIVFKIKEYDNYNEKFLDLLFTEEYQLMF